MFARKAWPVAAAILLAGCQEVTVIETSLSIVDSYVCPQGSPAPSIRVDTYVVDVFRDTDRLGCFECFKPSSPCERYRQCLFVEPHEISEVATLESDLSGVRIGPFREDDRLCPRIMAYDRGDDAASCEDLRLPLDYTEPFVCAADLSDMSSTMLSIAQGSIELDYCPNYFSDPFMPYVACLGSDYPPPLQ